MKKNRRVSVYVILLISFLVFVLYLFSINFSIDTIILFLSSKIFLGRWLAHGVVPLFNPHIFLGVPFLFDVGLGNLHPFNLLFMLPYPFSFAIWSAFASFLMMYGFYRFFRLFAKTDIFALLLALVFFLSGSGFMRNNNPTIYLVIAHYGIYLYSLKFLLKNKSLAYVPPLIAGFLMTLAGHIQFVFYGYLIAGLFSLFILKVRPVKIIVHFSMLFISTFWYYALSLPLIFDSTRLTMVKDYVQTGSNSIMHYLQLFLPFYLGYVENGSKWNVGPTYTILSSLFFTITLLVLLLNKRVSVPSLFFLLVMVIASLGFINLPFFRGAGQITILIHVFGLYMIAVNEEFVLTTLRSIPVKTIVFAIVFVLSGILFFYSRLFLRSFIGIYQFVKHRPPNLFFDNETISAIGKLFGLSIGALLPFTLSLWLMKKIRKPVVVLLICVGFEGLFVNYFHSFFIPSNVLMGTYRYDKINKGTLYRVQSASDVIPYFGISTYMGDVLFRPPFSKETPVFNNSEKKTLQYLRGLFSYIPSTWIMTTPYYGVQGFNTFIPKRLTHYFNIPSSDFEKEYGYIIERNALFASKKDNTSINGLETSQVTLNDPRWSKLGVKYFISDRPLKNYTLIEKSNGKYLYDNIDAPAIYSLMDDSGSKPLNPTYLDPNRMEFNVSKSDVGKSVRIIINPEGFKASINGKAIDIKTEQFVVIVPITSPGKLVVQYDPVLHLRQSLMLP